MLSVQFCCGQAQIMQVLQSEPHKAVPGNPLGK
jgi:hypothetical protein